jgi:hypothetical protein
MILLHSFSTPETKHPKPVPGLHRLQGRHLAATLLRVVFRFALLFALRPAVCFCSLCFIQCSCTIL